MNSQAAETFSKDGVVVLCVTVGVVSAIAALALFFTALNWFTSRGAKPEAVAIRGVLKKDTWVTVHMAGAETFDRVRFVGFTSAEGVKSHVPYDLAGMVILEDPAGRRFIVRAKAVRMVVVEPAAGAAPR